MKPKVALVTILRKENITEKEKEVLISGSGYGCARGPNMKIDKIS